MSTQLLHRSRSGRAAEWIVIGVIAGCYCLVFPVGEYAILDDWAYVKSLEHLHFKGRFHILDWNPMSLVGLLLWGLLFTKMLGFSFTVTKVSVVAAHAIECIALLRILRGANVRCGWALAAVFALLFQPLHFVHCHLFMTDIPAITWQWVALACLLKGLDDDQDRPNVWLVIGSLCAGLSFITRQHGILIGAAILTYFVIWGRRRHRAGSLLSSLVPLGLIVTNFTVWYRYVHGWTRTFTFSSKTVSDFMMHPPWADVPVILFAFCMYIGLIVAPLTLSVGVSKALPRSRWRIVASGAVAWFLIYCFTAATFKEDYFPYIRNVVTPWGYFQPGEFVLGARETVWGNSAAVVIGILCLASAVQFVAVLLRGCGRGAGEHVERGEPRHESRPETPRDTGNRNTDGERRLRTVRVLLSLLGLQLAYLLVTAPILFDRHLLILTPTTLALVALLVEQRRPRWPIYTAIVLIYAVYSILGTREVHSISRAVSQAGDQLVEEGIPASQIDAGYAFDGWHMYERSDAERRADVIVIERWWPQHEPVPPPVYKQPWWVVHLIPAIEPDYVVSLSPQVSASAYGGGHRYEVIAEVGEYRSFWPWIRRPVYVLRDASHQTDATANAAIAPAANDQSPLPVTGPAIASDGDDSQSTSAIPAAGLGGSADAPSPSPNE